MTLLPRRRHVAEAMHLLGRVDVLHAGRDTFPLAPDVRAVSTYRIWSDVEPL
jgi:hypothetical protein